MFYPRQSGVAKAPSSRSSIASNSRLISTSHTTPFDSTSASLHVHNTYLAGLYRQLSSKNGLGLSTTSSNDEFNLDPGSQQERQKGLQDEHLARDQRLNLIFQGARRPKLNSRQNSDRDKPSESGSVHGSKHASLRGYAEQRLKKQERLEERILKATNVQRLEWEAKSALLNHSYSLAIMLLARAGVLGSAAACESLSRLYAFGVTRGNKPVVTMVERDPLRSLAWALQTLRFLDAKLQRQPPTYGLAISSGNGKTGWELASEVLEIIPRVMIAPELRALSTDQKAEPLMLPDLKASAHKNPPRETKSDALEENEDGARKDVWKALEEAVERLREAIDSEQVFASIRSSEPCDLGPDEEEEVEAVKKVYKSLMANLSLGQAVLLLRKYVLDPTKANAKTSHDAWLVCTRLLDGDHDEMATVALAGLSCAQSGMSIHNPSSGNLQEEIGKFQSTAETTLPELKVQAKGYQKPDRPGYPAFSSTAKAKSHDYLPIKAKEKRRRESLRDLEPEDVDTAAKLAASVRPALSTRSSNRSAPSASIVSISVPGQSQEPTAFESLESRARLVRTISQNAIPQHATSSLSPPVDSGHSFGPQLTLPLPKREGDFQSLDQPPSPTSSIKSTSSINFGRPRRPSSVISVSPSLMFPPSSNEEAEMLKFGLPTFATSHNLASASASTDASEPLPDASTLLSQALSRSRTLSSLAPESGTRHISTSASSSRPQQRRTPSGGMLRPRVTSMYSSPSLSDINVTSSKAASVLSSSGSTSLGPTQSQRTRRMSASSGKSSIPMPSSRSAAVGWSTIQESPDRSASQSGLPIPVTDRNGNENSQSLQRKGKVSTPKITNEGSAALASTSPRSLKSKSSVGSLRARRDSKGDPIQLLSDLSKSVGGKAILLKPDTTVKTNPLLSAASVALQNVGSDHGGPTKSASSTLGISKSQPQQEKDGGSPAFFIRSVSEEDSEAGSAIETRSKKDSSGPKFSSALMAGALSGFTVDVLFYPIDTIKTRLQSSQGFLAAGGFKGVYRGIGSTALGSAPGASIFFVTYERMKSKISKELPDIFGESGSFGPPGLHMVSASIAEVAACMIRVPTEVVKSRQQTSTYGSKTTTFQAFRTVFKESGIRGYYRGFAGTVGREIPFTCIQFPLYENLKLQMSRSSLFGNDKVSKEGKSQAQLVRELPTWQAGLAGSVAGAIAAGLTTPLDVVKTRIMLHRKNQPATTGRGGVDLDVKGKELPPGVNTKILPTLRHIAKNEGAKALFSGFVPRTLWIGFGGAVFLGTFDAGVKVLDG